MSSPRNVAIDEDSETIDSTDERSQDTSTSGKPRRRRRKKEKTDPANLESAHSELKSEASDLQAENAALTKLLERVRKELKETEAELTEVHTTADRFMQSNRQKQTDLEVLNKKLKELESKVEDKRQSITALKKSTKDAEETLVLERNDHEYTKGKLKQIERKLYDKEVELRAVKESIQEARVVPERTRWQKIRAFIYETLKISALSGLIGAVTGLSLFAMLVQGYDVLPLALTDAFGVIGSLNVIALVTTVLAITVLAVGTWMANREKAKPVIALDKDAHDAKNEIRSTSDIQLHLQDKPGLKSEKSGKSELVSGRDSSTASFVNLWNRMRSIVPGQKDAQKQNDEIVKNSSYPAPAPK